MITINSDGLKSFGYEPDTTAAAECLRSLKTGVCKGFEYTGWIQLPNYINSEEYGRIKALGARLNKEAEAFVVLGIGGSYLGAKAAMDFLLSARYNEVSANRPKIYFLGNGMDAADILQVLELVKGKNLYVNVISKSGTTLETALAFRIFRNYLEETYGKEEAGRRIIATTDAKKGVLKSLSVANGYETFIVPGNVGGRYSVLTAVGLLPLAVSGIDTDEILKGAYEASEKYLKEDADNIALQYAASRHEVYKSGKTVEILSLPNESTRFFGEWWKQLFAESEGKDNKGVFPCSCIYSADLHSIGQYIQDGERNLFETNLSFKDTDSKLYIKSDSDDADKLNYLNSKEMLDIFNAAKTGVKEAHIKGGVPFIELSADKQDAKSLGELICFFEVSCAVSSLMNGVNPFNQPGVEEYKANMFKLLGRKD